MKRLTFALALLSATTTTNTLADNYHVTARIAGLADGTRLELIPVSHDKEQPLSQATITDGTATFSGVVDEPICASIHVSGSYGTLQLMLGNETTTITATAKEGKTWDGSASLYSFSDVKTSGSPLTNKLYSYTSVRDTLNQVRTLFEDRYKDLQARLSSAQQSKDAEAVAKIKASDEYLQMSKEDAEFFRRVEASYNRVVNENKETFWGPLLLVNLTSYLTPDQRSVYESFSDAAKASYYGRKVKDELHPAGSVGQRVPDFTVKDDQGQAHTLQSLLAGKKYMVLDFWASWCVPCRKEIPNVKRQYDLYKEKGLQVVSISIDKNADAWRKAVKAENLVWPNFLSPDVADLYKVRAVPTMYLLDSRGCVVAEGSDARGENLASKLAELFK